MVDEIPRRKIFMRVIFGSFSKFPFSLFSSMLFLLFYCVCHAFRPACEFTPFGRLLFNPKEKHEENDCVVNKKWIGIRYSRFLGKKLILLKGLRKIFCLWHFSNIRKQEENEETKLCNGKESFQVMSRILS